VTLAELAAEAPIYRQNPDSKIERAMITIKKILVPVDFSDLSIKALIVANKVAQMFEARVTPVHVHVPVSEMDEPYALGMSSSLYQDLDKVQVNLSKSLTQTAEKHVSPAVLTKPEILFGNPSQSLIDKANDFDIVIMSSHGRTGFSRFLLGSVAEKLLRLAPVPVMIIEDETGVGQFERILVTTDLSENSRAVFPLARTFAAKAGSKIHLLNVLSFEQVEMEDEEKVLESTRLEELEALVEEEFKEFKDQLTYNVETAFTSPHEAILRHVRKYDYNLVLMSTVGRTGIKHLMMGSTTTNVVRHVDRAVLSINPRAKTVESY